MTTPSYSTGSASAPRPDAPFNVLSIVTLIGGILGFNLVAVILGHIALVQLKRTGERGRTLAIVGLVLGYLGIVVVIIVAVLFFTAIAISSTSP